MRRSSVAFVALQLALITPGSAVSPRPALRRPSIERSPSLLAASGDQADSSQATSGIVPTAFQIINNVAGAGILTLSAGMAAGIGWVPAIAICIVLGIISGYTFYLLGEACALTGTVRYTRTRARSRPHTLVCRAPERRAVPSVGADHL